MLARDTDEQTAIPVIDFAPFLTGGAEERLRVGQAVYQAAHFTGFMYLKNFGITADVIDAAFALAADFFGRPPEVKRKSAYDEKINFGYGGLEKESLDPSKPADLKETFTMSHALFIPQDQPQWPDKEFRDEATGFYSECANCAQNIMRAFALALELEETFFDGLHTGKQQTLRLLNYPPTRVRADEQLGAGAHTDYGTLTLLFQDHRGGLQVQGRNGEWIDADPIPETIIINTGDLIQRWSNDVFRSTLHRVKVRPENARESRQSIAFFSDPDPEVKVETIASCISEDNPEKYPMISAEEYIRQRILASQVYY